MLFKTGLLALFAVLIFYYFINPYTTKADEGVVVGLFQVVMVVWGLLSAFLYSRADEEWKKTQTAVLTHDLETFMVEAPKKIPRTSEVLYGIISVIAIISGWGFHISSPLVFLLLGFFNFLIVFVYFLIRDLDDPIYGVVNISNIPKAWLEKLNC